MRKALRYLALMAIPFLAGCQQMGFMMYALTPEKDETKVEARYAGLQGKTLAIVVLADPHTLLEYHEVQLELSDAVGSNLRKNVKDLNLVAPGRVLRYLDENPKAGSMAPEKLAGVFNADYVLIVTLLEYSTREPSSISLYRGKALAEASLWPAVAPNSDPRDPVKPTWQSETIKIVYPPEAPQGIPVNDDRVIRIKTAQLFADELAKNFYVHTVPDNKKPLDRS